MSGMERFMALATVGSAFLEKMLLKRFLLGMVSIMVLAIIIGCLVAALLMGGLYLACRLLIEHGMSADMALLMAGAVSVLLIAASAFAIRIRIRRLRRNLVPKMPKLPSRITNTAEAFIDGLLTPSLR